MTRRPRPPRPPRRRVDPRSTLPIAVVVDSGGNPVDASGRPVTLRGGGRLLLDAEGRFVDDHGDVVDPSGTGIVGIYRQETSLPGSTRGRHVLWFSDEPGGDAGVYQSAAQRDPATGKRIDLRPPHLRGFQESAKTGELSATYRLTDWGRVASRSCRCRSGAGLRETPRPNADRRGERGGLSSREWKRAQRRLAREREPAPPQPPPAPPPRGRGAASRRPTRFAGVDYPSRKDAAAALGVSRQKLWRMLKREQKQ